MTAVLLQPDTPCTISGEHDVFRRNNVSIFGKGAQTLVFAHGLGGDQNMWRFVIPAFVEDYTIIAFDTAGAGGADLNQFDARKYSSLHGYAEDVIDILHAAGKRQVIFIGHSVSALIGILAAIRAPELFARLILLGPSPGYINDGDYIGGFERDDIEQMLEFLDANYFGWSSSMAPAIMGNADLPMLAGELENSFCRTDPAIARHFARVAFLSDHRADLPKLRVPSLILQCSDDVIAPEPVGRYLHAHLANSTFVQLKATGHCPNLSAPGETIAAIKKYLRAVATP